MIKIADKVYQAVNYFLPELIGRVGKLETGANKRYPVHLGTDALTQEQYQAAYETVSGNAVGATPPNGATLVNLDNNHSITYFANAEGDKWIDRGIDTISVADNNGTLGAVTGSTDIGKVSVGLDGVMSVKGFIKQYNPEQNINFNSNLPENITSRVLTTEQLTQTGAFTSTEVVATDSLAMIYIEQRVEGSNINNMITGYIGRMAIGEPAARVGSSGTSIYAVSVSFAVIEGQKWSVYFNASSTPSTRYIKKQVILP
jgi:hypothetical protein